MQTRRIGALDVSVIGLGCNQLGTTCDAARSRLVIDAALTAGITFFDTADEYGDGRSEEVIGQALRGRRDRVVIATKFGGPRGDTHRTGARPDWIRTAASESLARLRTDYIDLYQLHFPDPTVPIAETLGTLGELITAGIVREIGCSNLSAVQLDDAAGAAAAGALRPFASVQSRLNLLRREALTEIIPACERHGLAFLPYFPLASGLLTGKYHRGESPPPGSRLALQVAPAALPKLLSDLTLTRIERLESWSATRGRTLPEVALAWLLRQPRLASVIAGATRPEQVAANARAATVPLSAAELAELDSLLRELG